jgi:cyclophilin family peptidyl-prolyl cis-trans isomerase
MMPVMRKNFLFACAATLAALPLSAQEAKPEYPAPSEIVAKAGPQEWVAIAPSDLMVMELTPDAKGKARRVIIQLMPAPFSQGWIGNIRTLAASKFWDGTSVNRVQDNYVVQWGDATEKKALPDGLAVVPEFYGSIFSELDGHIGKAAKIAEQDMFNAAFFATPGAKIDGKNLSGHPKLVSSFNAVSLPDSYAPLSAILGGWPFGYYITDDSGSIWPVHCYGMVGVGRNLSPDTGTGAELYTVIGHAPRHLDRNIALVGRVIEGIEHLSSLPRGTGALGFYESEAERTPIMSVRIGNDASDLPAFEYLSTESESFAAYADARANRRDPFFNVPAGGTDICNIPVPVRRRAAP